MGFLDQVNYCLTEEYFVDYYNELISKNKLKISEDKILEHLKYTELLFCNNPKFTEHYKLAIAYFKKDIKKFLDIAKNMDIDKTNLKEWFIFKRLKGQPEVDNFFKS